MAFQAYFLSPEGDLRRDHAEREIQAAYESKQGLLWVDISENREEHKELLERVFHFHPLSVEDCVSRRVHAPKIDDFGDHLFIIVHGVSYTADSDIVQTAELAIFLGPHFVVSSHSLALPSVELVRRAVEEENGGPMRRGADFLAHALMDAIVDNVLPTIDRMNEVVERIEEEVLRSPDQSTLEGILKVKRSMLRIQRVMVPQREIFNRLSRAEFSMISQEAQIFYRDIYDHVVRIEDMNQTLREMADHAMTTYLSSVTIRQNEIMRVLSIVASIFLPLTLVTGIYGMNFENMPELQWPWAYFAVLGFMALVTIVNIWLFWVRGWITWGRRQAARSQPFGKDLDQTKD